MRSIYPRIQNQQALGETNELVGNVAEALRNSRGDKILNARGVIRSFVKANPNKVKEIEACLESCKDDLSYMSELHVQRISWIKAEINIISK